MQINPAISICENGFNVSLPIAFCVLSPSLYAVYACANSWNVIAINTPGMLINKLMSFPGTIIYSNIPIIINIANIVYIVFLSNVNILNKIITPILYVYYIILFKICK